MKALYLLFLRLLGARSRVLGLLAFGAIGVVNASVVRDEVSPEQALGLVDAYALGLVAPVVALMFASAALGDLVDDSTLVYLWLRPLSRTVLAGASLTAALTLAVPLAVAPAVAIAYVVDGGAAMLAAAAVSTTLATLAYCAVFLALGLRVRRALAWGMAYVLLWEGVVSRAARGAARLSIQSYARSVLHRLAEFDPPAIASSPTVAVVVPLVITAAAFAITVRWLRRIEVA